MSSAGDFFLLRLKSNQSERSKCGWHAACPFSSLLIEKKCLRRRTPFVSFNISSIYRGFEEDDAPNGCVCARNQIIKSSDCNDWTDQPIDRAH